MSKEKEFKGTVGEWKLSQSQYGSKLFGQHTGFNVTANSGQRTVCNVTLNNAVGVPQEERQANAKLIAAAPDLLFNLKEALSVIDQFSETGEFEQLKRNMKTAIKKTLE